MVNYTNRIENGAPAEVKADVLSARLSSIFPFLMFSNTFIETLQESEPVDMMWAIRHLHIINLQMSF